ncbi:hypothetical protein [Variovorax sp. E3]|uniref:hypothetical protein n=1 Tax=Variovorax sp. E3 TaxID=1914993 RepID=UPI0018DD929F|nr:hypothetical protein [Variovorax sp. E3]
MQELGLALADDPVAQPFVGPGVAACGPSICLIVGVFLSTAIGRTVSASRVPLASSYMKRPAGPCSVMTRRPPMKL